MLNQKLSIFNKGNFESINQNFMTEGLDVLQQMSVIQEKYNKNDTDTFINELRDSIVGNYLGFDLVNTEKHGFDCKSSKAERFLEAKDASFDAAKWIATFNDTTLEKAKAFKDKKVYLALAVWKGASDLLFICYGQHEKIGDFLEYKVNWFKSGKTVRSTQTISLSTLVTKYNFKILAIGKTPTEILSLLRAKNSAFNTVRLDRITGLADFKGIK